MVLVPALLVPGREEVLGRRAVSVRLLTVA